MQGEARLPVACFSMGRHAVGVGDRWKGNSTSRDRRVALDIARWRGHHAGASRRGSCRALQWRGRSKSAPAVDMNYRRFLRRNNWDGSAPAVDVDDGWSREDRCRGCLYRGRLLLDRGRRGPLHTAGGAGVEGAASTGAVDADMPTRARGTGW